MEVVVVEVALRVEAGQVALRVEAGQVVTVQRTDPVDTQEVVINYHFTRIRLFSVY